MVLETEPKFSSPQEEVEWLKQRIQEKLTEAEKAKETKPPMEAAKEAVKEHMARPPEKTLAPEYKISEEEAGAKVLELKPEPHDRQIEERLGVLEEKGILNAVSVCRKLDPHLEDDFHRVLIQYLLEKINKEKAGFSKSKAKLFRGLKMVLYEVALPQEELKAVPQEGKTFKDFISRMEQFYSGMAAISEKKGFSLWPRPAPYFVLELALPAIGEEISFYAAIPRNQKGLLEKQIWDVKEAFTVLLNSEFSSIRFREDLGYPENKKIREAIEKSWKKNRDFDKALESAIKIVVQKTSK